MRRTLHYHSQTTLDRFRKYQKNRKLFSLSSFQPPLLNNNKNNKPNNNNNNNKPNNNNNNKDNENDKDNEIDFIDINAYAYDDDDLMDQMDVENNNNNNNNDDDKRKIKKISIEMKSFPIVGNMMGDEEEDGDEGGGRSLPGSLFLSLYSSRFCLVNNFVRFLFFKHLNYLSRLDNNYNYHFINKI